VDWDDALLSVRRQCELLGLHRATAYYKPVGETDENLCLMRRIDEQYLQTPFFGSRRMADCLTHEGGLIVNRKRVQRLMRLMDIEAIYPRPRTTESAAEHRKYPYLLRGRRITKPDEVWAADITYIPMAQGYMYLVAIIDWYSRYVLAWRLSNSLESSFCVEVLEEALAGRRPEIFNTDQGVQFTSRMFTGRLEAAGVSISMDGKGRALDNVFIERLWWSLKYENIYLQCYETAHDLRIGLRKYFDFYCCQRPHQALGNRTPQEAYRQDREKHKTCGAKILAAPELRADVNQNSKRKRGTAAARHL
jgi:putative transposase